MRNLVRHLWEVLKLALSVYALLWALVGIAWVTELLRGLLLL